MSFRRTLEYIPGVSSLRRATGSFRDDDKPGAGGGFKAKFHVPGITLDTRGFDKLEDDITTTTGERAAMTMPDLWLEP